MITETKAKVDAAGFRPATMYSGTNSLVSFRLKDAMPYIPTGATLLREYGKRHVVTSPYGYYPGLIEDAALQAGKSLASLARPLTEGETLIVTRQQFHPVEDFNYERIEELYRDLLRPLPKTHTNNWHETAPKVMGIVDLTRPDRVVLGGVDLVDRDIYTYTIPRETPGTRNRLPWQ